MGIKEKDTATVMSSAKGSGSEDKNQSSQLPRVVVQSGDIANTSSANSSLSQSPSQPHTPQQQHSGLVSGLRSPSLQQGDRPNSAPPHSLEQLSGMLHRHLGDHFESSTAGQTLRIMGDQLKFEQDIRRALSSSALDSMVQHNDR